MPKTTGLAKKLLDMQAQLNTDSLDEQAAQQLSALSEQASELEAQVKTLESDPESRRQQ